MSDTCGPPAALSQPAGEGTRTDPLRAAVAKMLPDHEVMSWAEWLTDLAQFLTGLPMSESYRMSARGYVHSAHELAGVIGEIEEAALSVRPAGEAGGVPEEVRENPWQSAVEKYGLRHFTYCDRLKRRDYGDYIATYECTCGMEAAAATLGALSHPTVTLRARQDGEAGR